MRTDSERLTAQEVFDIAVARLDAGSDDLASTLKKEMPSLLVDASLCDAGARVGALAIVAAAYCVHTSMEPMDREFFLLGFLNSPDAHSSALTGS